MPVFKSTGYAQGKYNPGGGRKKFKKSSFIKSGTRKRKGNSKKSTYNKKTKSTKKTNKLDYKDVYRTIVDNQINVYKYPFSTATKYPKIPDGKTNLSIGLPFNYTQQLEQEFGLQGSDFTFFFYPGITSCCQVLDSTGTIIAGTHYIQHCLPHLNLIEDVEDGAVRNQISYKECGYQSYRYVSAAMRIGSDSTYLQNSGTWEAIRLPFGKVQDYFQLDLSEGNFNRVLAKYTYDEAFIDGFTNNPTYQCGALKSLGNYEFRLKDQVIEHDFIKIPEIVDFHPPEHLLNGNEVFGDGTNGSEMFGYIADPQFDMIIVHVSMVQDVNRLSFHTSCNIELEPNHHGNFIHFATETVTNKSKYNKAREDVEKFNRLPGTLRSNLYAKK